MKCAFVQSCATRLPLDDRCVDLTLASPPYMDARTYGINAQRKCDAWIDWMLDVLTELQRVTIGPVIIVAAGVTRKRNYQPGCEGLMYRWWQRGGDCQLYRPVYWHRVGIPGSGGTDWFRADVEYCMCFKRPGELPWTDNTACGHPPKWAPGGEMSNRLSSGARVNQWGHPIDSGGTAGALDDVTCAAARPSHRLAGEVWGGGGTSFGRRANGDKIPPAKLITRRGRNGTRDHRVGKSHTKALANDEMEDQFYIPPVKANPGNMFKCIVGGGVMGHPLAHENEAPYPTKLVEFFIKSLCPPGGIVLDPFSGSGTTACAAADLGRVGIGSDLRFTQCELGAKRFRHPAMKQKAKKVRPSSPELMTLFGGAA